MGWSPRAFSLRRQDSRQRRSQTERDGGTRQGVTGVLEGVDHREMITARHRNIFQEVIRPVLRDEMILAFELAAFESAHGGDRRASRLGGQVRCAQAGGRGRVEFQVAIDERSRQEGLEIVDPAHEQGRFCQVGWEVCRPGWPLGAQQHCGEMGTGGVTADRDQFAVECERIGTAVEPGAGLHQLAHDVLNRDLRAERIVHHCDINVRCQQGPRNPGKIMLVERAPISAVNEDEERRAGDPAAEIIQR